MVTTTESEKYKSKLIEKNFQISCNWTAKVAIKAKMRLA